MKIEITINSCVECRHCGHSGAFTPGGARPTCDHGMAVDASPKIVHGDMKYHWRRRVIPYNERPLTEEERRIYPHSIKKIREVAEIPDWCPLKNGAKY